MSTKRFLGYDTDEEGHLIVNRQQAKIVVRLYEEFLSGKTVDYIARIFKAEKIRNWDGKYNWQASTLGSMLRNEKYMGDAILQGRYTTQTLPFKRKVNKGELPKYYVENANPAIVTREVFEAVQILLDQRRSDSYAPRNRYPLSGILYCPDCGKKFRRQTTSGKAYWLCAARASGKTNCRSIRFPEERLEETFTLLLHKLRDNRESLIEPLIRKTEELYRRNHAYTAEIQSIDKEVADLAAQNHLVVQLYNQEMLSTEDYRRRVHTLNQNILELRRKRGRLLYGAEESRHLSELQQLREILKNSEDGWAFNPELFLDLVQRIQVETSESLTFEILGSIPLRERLAG